MDGVIPTSCLATPTACLPTPIPQKVPVGVAKTAPQADLQQLPQLPHLRGHLRCFEETELEMQASKSKITSKRKSGIIGSLPAHLRNTTHHSIHPALEKPLVFYVYYDTLYKTQHLKQPPAKPRGEPTADYRDSYLKKRHHSVQQGDVAWPLYAFRNKHQNKAQARPQTRNSSSTAKNFSSPSPTPSPPKKNANLHGTLKNISKRL